MKLIDRVGVGKKLRTGNLSREERHRLADFLLTNPPPPRTETEFAHRALVYVLELQKLVCRGSGWSAGAAHATTVVARQVLEQLVGQVEANAKEASKP